MIDPEFLALLRCPLHPDGPDLEDRGDYLICHPGNHAFPVIEGIPHMLPENAIPLSDLPAENPQ